MDRKKYFQLTLILFVFIKYARPCEDFYHFVESVIMHAIEDGIKENNVEYGTNNQKEIPDREDLVDSINDNDPNIGINDYGEYEYFPVASENRQKEINEIDRIRNIDDDNKEMSIAAEESEKEKQMEISEDNTNNDAAIITTPNLSKTDYQDIEEIKDKVIDRDDYDSEEPEELLAEILLKDGIITWDN